MGTFVGVTKKKGAIKVVEYLGDPDDLMIELYDYFKDISEAKLLAKTTIDYIEDGEIEFFIEYEDDFEMTAAAKVYEEYSNFDDLAETVDFSSDLYYIYDTCWKVVGMQYETLTEIETILEERN